MTFDEEINLLKGSGFVDAAWYLERYRDVAALGMDAAAHYLKYGAMMGRDPGPDFNTGFYLETYADVAQNKLNPLLHYVQHGQAEGRKITASTLV